MRGYIVYHTSRRTMIFLTLVLVALARADSGEELDGYKKIVENTVIANIKNARPKLMVQLKKGGFHKLIDYVIDLERHSKECDYTLEHRFPPAVYLDADELHGVASYKGYNITFPKFMDIEEPTESSQEFSLLIYPKLKNNHVSIPIHFRHHRPGSKRFVGVMLELPRLYTNCREESVGEAQKCFHEAEILSRKCGWVGVDNVLLLGDTILSTKIPQGEKSLGFTVSFITIAISWMGCASILYSIKKKTASLP